MTGGGGMTVSAILSYPITYGIDVATMLYAMGALCWVGFIFLLLRLKAPLTYEREPGDW